MIRIVRLGTPRAKDEGLRIGTVRKPPRGVPKNRFAKDDWYDVWFPNLAPSVPTMKLGLSAETDKQWSAFVRKYRAEMAKPDASLRSICSQRSQSTRISPSAATARTSLAATVAFFERS
jgi:uncharacterized protein YeaO (DUF488 family)